MKDLPEISEGGEEGFVDLQFRLATFERRNDGVVHLVARGVHRGTVVAFAVELDAAWKRESISGADASLHWGKGVLRSIGAESDAFANVLDELYGTALGVRAMKKQATVSIVGLANDPLLIATQRTQMKSFIESNDPSLCAEFYLNVVVPENVVELREKDPGYRRAVVLGLTEAAASSPAR